MKIKWGAFCEMRRLGIWFWLLSHSFRHQTLMSPWHWEVELTKTYAFVSAQQASHGELSRPPPSSLTSSPVLCPSTRETTFSTLSARTRLCLGHLLMLLPPLLVMHPGVCRGARRPVLPCVSYITSPDRILLLKMGICHDHPIQVTVRANQLMQVQWMSSTCMG